MKISRRRLLIATTTMVVCRNNVSASRAQTDDFQSQLDKLANDEDLLSATREYRERQSDEFDFYASRAVAPRRPPSDRRISPSAERLIVTFEVSSPQIYEKKYRTAVWPHGLSGVTIGVGYDLGYVTAEWFLEDWSEHLSPTELSTLKPACEVTGPKAQQILASIGSVVIPWEKAHDQFKRFVLQRYVAETIASLPNANRLSDDSLGALVSLVYNRGPSFKKQTDRYIEMRAIHLHMARREYSKIPGEIRSMKRNWDGDPKMRGLLVRRDLEADLFEKGLV
jgi:GH24 family phage-related lysozyme (muramidase)